jgi:hypothetical protein
MKKNLSLAYALLFAGAAGIALAQTDASTPAASTAPMKGMGKGHHPRIHEIRSRIESQNERIMAGVKNKKLTKDESKALHGKIKAVREELLSDIKSNGKEDLTEDQFKQLNQELDENSTAIHDEKSGGASTGGGGSATPSAP